MEVAPLAGARIETLMVCIIQTAGGSLPSRERELKPQTRIVEIKSVMSLPSRERELKLLSREYWIMWN